MPAQRLNSDSVRLEHRTERQASVLGRRIRYIPLSDEEARAGMLSSGMPDFCAGHLLDLLRAYRSGAGPQVSSDVKFITGARAHRVRQVCARPHARFRR